MLSGPHCQRSTNSFRTGQHPTSPANLTKDRLGPEPGRTPAVHSHWSAYRRTSNLVDSASSSTKISDFVLPFPGDGRRGGLVSAPRRNELCWRKRRASGYETLAFSDWGKTIRAPSPPRQSRYALCCAIALATSIRCRMRNDSWQSLRLALTVPSEGSQRHSQRTKLDR
jgi:hypothetical protein